MPPTPGSATRPCSAASAPPPGCAARAALPAEILLVAAAQQPERDYVPLLERLEPGPGPAFPLQGRDLLALGVPPGPEIGRMLGRVRDWWLAGGAAADHAACLERLRELVASGGS